MGAPAPEGPVGKVGVRPVNWLFKDSSGQEIQLEKQAFPTPLLFSDLPEEGEAFDAVALVEAADLELPWLHPRFQVERVYDEVEEEFSLASERRRRSEREVISRAEVRSVYPSLLVNFRRASSVHLTFIPVCFSEAKSVHLVSV